ncbi:DUF6879 family protein [Streptomyces buecherae]|uniref:DUF6879 family protein n=1 Tax=Streptomyces buecherae TaxID=2763006 RepID=UPI003656C06A
MPARWAVARIVPDADRQGATGDDQAAREAGEPRPAAYKSAGWVTTVREATQAGKRMYRVHVLARPLSDYLRFELGTGPPCGQREAGQGVGRLPAHRRPQASA